jgi:hypothetical protein
MALSAAAVGLDLTNRTLRKLHYAMANDAADIGTAATGDIMIMLDASDNYEPKYADAANVNELLGITATSTELNLLSGLLATAAEINSAVDVSTRIVTLTDTITLTAALHASKTLLLGEVGGNAQLTVTLPAATGTGNIYKFIVSVVNTSNYVIQKAGSDTFAGIITSLDNDSNAVTGYAAIAGSADDVVTLNGTTTGGQIGDCIIFEDILAAVWSVRGSVVVPAGSNVADMFS